jgi:hypothetical protein
MKGPCCNCRPGSRTRTRWWPASAGRSTTTGSAWSVAKHASGFPALPSARGDTRPGPAPGRVRQVRQVAAHALHRPRGRLRGAAELQAQQGARRRLLSAARAPAPRVCPPARRAPPDRRARAPRPAPLCCARRPLSQEARPAQRAGGQRRVILPALGDKTVPASANLPALGDKIVPASANLDISDQLGRWSESADNDARPRPAAGLLLGPDRGPDPARPARHGLTARRGLYFERRKTQSDSTRVVGTWARVAIDRASLKIVHAVRNIHLPRRRTQGRPRRGGGGAQAPEETIESYSAARAWG